MIKRNLPLMITIGVFVLGYLYCLPDSVSRFCFHKSDLQYPDR